MIIAGGAVVINNVIIIIIVIEWSLLHKMFEGGGWWCSCWSSINIIISKAVVQNLVVIATAAVAQLGEQWARLLTVRAQIDRVRQLGFWQHSGFYRLPRAQFPSDIINVIIIIIIIIIIIWATTRSSRIRITINTIITHHVVVNVNIIITSIGDNIAIRSVPSSSSSRYYTTSIMSTIIIICYNISIGIIIMYRNASCSIINTSGYNRSCIIIASSIIINAAASINIRWSTTRAASGHHLINVVINNILVIYIVILVII